MFQGFRDFILRGNVVDLATAVIIGVAFGGVVDGFIAGIVDPLIAVFSPGEVKQLESALVIGPFRIGLVLSAVVTFALKAAVVYFFIVRPFARLSARLAPAPAPAGPPADVVLLTEIRDLLKERK
jgi:large conductance mechanosensitive channel